MESGEEKTFINFSNFFVCCPKPNTMTVVFTLEEPKKNTFDYWSWLVFDCRHATSEVAKGFFFLKLQQSAESWGIFLITSSDVKKNVKEIRIAVTKLFSQMSSVPFPVDSKIGNNKKLRVREFSLCPCRDAGWGLNKGCAELNRRRAVMNDDVYERCC